MVAIGDVERSQADLIWLPAEGSDTQSSERGSALEAMRTVFGPDAAVTVASEAWAGPPLRVDVFRCRDVIVVRVHTEVRCTLDLGALDRYCVAVPDRATTTGVTATVNGVVVSGGSASDGVVIMPGQHGELNCQGGAMLRLVVVPVALVRSELEMLLGRATNAPVVFEPVVDLGSLAGGAVCDTIRLLEDFIQTIGEMASPLMLEHMAKLVTGGLLVSQPHNYAPAVLGSSCSTRPRAVQQAIDLMGSQPERPWTVTDLAQAVAVGARSLQKGFQRSVGMSPLRYLREIRLDKARDRLTAATDRTTVAGVASSLGFGDFGRFASTYRSKFGEVPSETLRRSMCAGYVTHARPERHPGLPKCYSISSGSFCT